MSDSGHVPVLLGPVLEGLNIKKEGTYVDATFGRGGHSRAILDALGSEGRLIAIDRDPDWAHGLMHVCRASTRLGDFLMLRKP